MDDNSSGKIGTMVHFDLTVPDAAAVRDFYRAVIGWETKPESMGEYEDYHMLQPDTQTPVAGICHKRGINANLPSQWLLYITVADLEASITACLRLGGKVVTRYPAESGWKMAVIEDPAGAVLALIET